MSSDSGDRANFLKLLVKNSGKLVPFCIATAISLTYTAHFPESDVMHTEFHSMIIEDLRSESAERKKKGQYYMNSEDFWLRPENFPFHDRTESQNFGNFLRIKLFHFVLKIIQQDTFIFQSSSKWEIAWKWFLLQFQF